MQDVKEGAVLKAPFPYFGGKSRIAGAVWERLGNPAWYVEPFAGSAAMLLARPWAHEWWDKHEIINDADGFVCNFWRAVQAAPDEVAHHADYPPFECDLHARHFALVTQRGDLARRLEGDPAFYDARLAGWWVWGISAWISGGWCAGDGPWRRDSSGRLTRGGDGLGVNRSRPHLSSEGQGIHRKVQPGGDEPWHQVVARSAQLRAWFSALADRLRNVRVCTGDWTRVVGPTVTKTRELTGVFLDPPYPPSERDVACYNVDTADVAYLARDWAVANGENPLLRIALCGYEGTWEMPDSWSSITWTAHGGYAWVGEGRGRANRERETVWFSPHCEKVAQYRLPGLEDAK